MRKRSVWIKYAEGGDTWLLRLGYNETVFGVCSLSVCLYCQHSCRGLLVPCVCMSVHVLRRRTGGYSVCLSSFSQYCKPNASPQRCTSLPSHHWCEHSLRTRSLPTLSVVSILAIRIQITVLVCVFLLLPKKATSSSVFWSPSYTLLWIAYSNLLSSFLLDCLSFSIWFVGILGVFCIWVHL